MTMEIKAIEKKVQKFSKAGYGIYLTKELKEIGNPAEVIVLVMDGRLIISKKTDVFDVFELIKPLNIDNILWKDFLYAIDKIHGNKSYELINKSLEDAIHNWIVDQREEKHILFGFTIYKKKRF